MTALDYDDISGGSLVGLPHQGQGHLTLDTRDEMLWHHYAKQQQQQQQHQQQHQQQQHHHHHHPHLQQQPPQHYYNDGVGTWLLRGGGGGGGFNATPTSVAAQIGRLSPSAENLPSTLQQHQLALQQQQQQQGMDATSFGVAPKFHQSDPELLYGNEAPLLLQDCNADSMVSKSYLLPLPNGHDPPTRCNAKRITHARCTRDTVVTHDTLPTLD